MAFTKPEEWDETPINNTEMNGIDLQENVMRPPAVNNQMREHMAQMAKWLGDDTIASASTTDLGSVPGRYVSITGTTTITAFGTIKAGTVKYVKFAAALTLTHNGTSLILPGAANITTAAGDMAIFVSEGSGNWLCVTYNRVPGIGTIYAARVTLTTQTEVDFPIPPWARNIKVMFAGLSTSGSSVPIIQIGDSGGIETTAYVSVASNITSSGVSSSAYTTGFGLDATHSAAATLSGVISLDFYDSNAWLAGGNVSWENTTATSVISGRKTLSAALTTVRITTVNGSDTLDSGTILVAWSA